LKNPDNRDISFGVNSILNTSILEAVKTGTSSNFRDNVVVSYNPNFILGIWI
jgi:membrane carboxypeptidase/penicillin-binding protein PbpC